MGIIDWLFSPYGDYEEPADMYHHEKIHFKTSLRTYCGILTINNRDNEYQLKIFIGEPYFRDGTLKYLHEAVLIGETEWEELENAKQIIKVAHEIIKEYEVKERTLSYFKLKRNFIVLKNEEEEEAPAKVTPPPKPAVYDHEQRAYENYITYLTEHPEEIESLEPEERERILKENLELRLAYHEWRGIQSAQRQGGDK